MKTRLTALAVFIGALLLVAPAAGRVEQDPRAAYIVVLDADANASDVAAQHARRFGANVSHVYTHALKGYAALLPAGAVEGIARSPQVAWVEADGVATADTTQSNPPWGLDRIDERTRSLNGEYAYSNTGSGVTAYVIDTGILLTHSDFGGRAITGFDAITSGGTATDCNGHGTHVAGTVGGSTYGVAKDLTLVAVRVLSCSGSGTWSQVIAGIDWVTRNHAAGQPAVANMSLGGSANSSVDLAVSNMIADGVATAVAAGNGNQGGRQQDACKSSPARVATAMTIGATDSADRKASWSNYGNCVDWFAPGVSIKSSWSTGDTATNTISGTSMATPHTAGVAALYLQSNTGASAGDVREALYAKTTKGVVTSSSTANNHLLFTDY